MRAIAKIVCINSIALYKGVHQMVYGYPSGYLILTKLYKIKIKYYRANQSRQHFALIFKFLGY